MHDINRTGCISVDRLSITSIGLIGAVIVGVLSLNGADFVQQISKLNAAKNNGSDPSAAIAMVMSMMRIMLWIVLPTLAAKVVTFIFRVTEGTKGPNRYGPDPKGDAPTHVFYSRHGRPTRASSRCFARSCAMSIFRARVRPAPSSGCSLLFYYLVIAAIRGPGYLYRRRPSVAAMSISDKLLTNLHALRRSSSLFNLAILPAEPRRAAVRRLHDIRRSGWWLLFPTIVSGIIAYIVFFVVEGRSSLQTMHGHGDQEAWRTWASAAVDHAGGDHVARGVELPLWTLMLPWVIIPTLRVRPN